MFLFSWPARLGKRIPRMSRMKAALSLSGLATTVLANSGTIETEDTELRDLDVTGWDCANQFEGTAQSQDAKERNRMKNRWAPVNLSVFTVEQLDTVAFLKKVARVRFPPSKQTQRRADRGTER